MTRRALPLAAAVGLLGAAGVLAVSATAAAGLAVTGRLDLPAELALAAGALAGLVVVLLAVVAARRVAGALDELRDDALRRLAAPDVAEVGAPPRARPAAELAGLGAVVEALHGRVRLADALARRSRRDAEAASAGVFELLSGLVAAEEGARGQLAAELHDTVAQSLVIARGLLAARPSTPADLARLAEFVDDAEEQVRAVMARTRPPALHDGDLAAAVSGLQADWRHRYGLEVAVRWPAAPHALPAATAVTVYRFFQEALHNVVKHADVDDAELALEVDATSLTATVSDDGPGFDPAGVRPDRGRHVGLGLLRERARLSGGTLEVRSLPGRGTTLTLRLPRPVAPAAPSVPPPVPLPTVTVPAAPRPVVAVPAQRTPGARSTATGVAGR